RFKPSVKPEASATAASGFGCLFPRITLLSRRFAGLVRRARTRVPTKWLLTWTIRLLVSPLLKPGSDENVSPESKSERAQVARHRRRWRDPRPARRADSRRFAREEQTGFHSAPRRRRLWRGHQRREGGSLRKKRERETLHELFRLEGRGKLQDRGPDTRRPSRA